MNRVVPWGRRGLSRGHAVVAVAALVATILVAQNPGAHAVDCGGAATPVSDPDSLTWVREGTGEDAHWVGTLEYGEATFTTGGRTFTTRAYREPGGEYSIPGPTLRMQPGETYVLRFRNLLPFEPVSHEHNTFTDPNVTNVHTHGLHVSGETPSDDVTRMFPGGTGGDYVYEIPDDHMGGTFWYHAHHHGSTYLQVSTGAFGLIVVDDANDAIPAPVAAMAERDLLVGYLDDTAAGTGGDTLVSGDLPGWTVNGTVDGTVCLPPGTWQHWRVLLADRDATPKDLAIGAGCEVHLLARDGVWRTTAPKPLTEGRISLTGASRADLAVRCDADSTIRVGNTQVATIHVTGTPDPGPGPFAEDGGTWSATRPTYLQDLRGVAPAQLHRERINMGARTVNGTKFDVEVPNLVLTADAVQEWDLKGASNHPFHLHVYHMQAMAGCGGSYEEGEWYDVVAANCAVRFDLRASVASPYAGRTIMHCHILAHEDQGAMGWADVIGGAPPPIYPDGFGYAAEYDLGVPPPPPPPGPDPTQVLVDSVVVELVDVGKGQRQGRAIVRVVDDLGDPVPDATVVGSFGGDLTETDLEAVTGTDGIAEFHTTGSAKGKVAIEFCATAITHAALEDWSGSACGTA